MKNDLIAFYIPFPLEYFWDLFPRPGVRKIPLHLLYDVYQDSPKETMSVYFFYHTPEKGWWTSRPEQNGNCHSVTYQEGNAGEAPFLILQINPFGEARFPQADAAETPGCFYAIMGRNSENRLELVARLRVNDQQVFNVSPYYLFDSTVEPLCLLEAIVGRGRSEDQLDMEVAAIYEARNEIYFRGMITLEGLVAILAIEKGYLPSFPTSQFEDDLLRLKQEPELVDICNNLIEGNKSWSRNHRDDAVRFYREALVKSRQFSERTGDRRREVVALIRLSDILYLLDRREQADQVIEEALTISRKIGTPTLDETLIVAARDAFRRECDGRKRSDAPQRFQLNFFEYCCAALRAPGGDLTFTYVGFLAEAYHRFHSFKQGFHFLVDYYPSEGDCNCEIFLYAIAEDAWVTEELSTTSVVVHADYRLCHCAAQTPTELTYTLGRVYSEIEHVVNPEKQQQSPQNTLGDLLQTMVEMATLAQIALYHSQLVSKPQFKPHLDYSYHWAAAQSDQ